MDGELVENFFGVYLLYCMNPTFKGRTYIGFTVDPNRRIKQHNSGVKSGGAYRTNNKGPWKMILIIHGFPNDISALRFEWAWTYPQKSRRLNSIPRKKSKESKYEFCLRILGVMLRTNPWSRLPLTIRWLDQEFQRDFQIGSEPPLHMPVAYGSVNPAKVKPSTASEVDDSSYKCDLCHSAICADSLMRCLDAGCTMSCHMICLSKQQKDKKNIIPIEVQCPVCQLPLLWGDLVRLKKGCYQQNSEEFEEPHWCDILTQNA